MSSFKEQQQNSMIKDCKVIFFQYNFLEKSNSPRSTCSPHQMCYHRASQHFCSTAVSVILLWFMSYPVFSSKHCVNAFRKDIRFMGKLCGRNLFFVLKHEQLLFWRIFSMTVSFLKMGNSIPEKGTKTWHQRHCGKTLWYNNYKRYICNTPKKPQLCK